MSLFPGRKTVETRHSLRDSLYFQPLLKEQGPSFRELTSSLCLICLLLLLNSSKQICQKHSIFILSLGSVLCLSMVSEFGAICILAYVFILTVAFMLKICTPCCHLMENTTTYLGPAGSTQNYLEPKQDVESKTRDTSSYQDPPVLATTYQDLPVVTSTHQ